MQRENVVYVIDSDQEVGNSLATLLGIYYIPVRAFPSAESFQKAHSAGRTGGCLVIGATPPDSGGASLLRRLRAEGFRNPVILLADGDGGDLRRQVRELEPVEVIDKPLVTAFLAQRLSELLPGAPGVPAAPLGGRVVANGRTVNFRVMRPEDDQIEQEFVRGLSASSRHLRFFGAGLRELSPEMLHRFTHPAYPKSYALIATVSDHGRERIIGVARYAEVEDPGSAEFAVVVADDWQGMGIATELLHGLLTAAAVAGLSRVEGMVLKENSAMLKLVRELGFEISPCREEPAALSVVKRLRTPQSPNGWDSGDKDHRPTADG